MIAMRALHRKCSLTALLLLCLSGFLWLQGEHIHLDEPGQLHECLVCHHSAAAAVGEAASNLPLAPQTASLLAPTLSAMGQPASLRPPARAPPVYLA